MKKSNELPLVTGKKSGFWRAESPVRMSFPGGDTMIRFNADDIAHDVSRDLLEKLGANARAAVEDAYRRGLTEGYAAATGAAAVSGGAL